MWTKITRPEYERTGRRYASDATDEEWSRIAPLLPPAKPGGRPRTTNLRDVFDAILYMASTGCQWRMPLHPVRPADLGDGQLLPARNGAAGADRYRDPGHRAALAAWPWGHADGGEVRGEGAVAGFRSLCFRDVGELPGVGNPGLERIRHRLPVRRRHRRARPPRPETGAGAAA